MLDAQAVRKDFPVFDREVNGRPLVYLDSAATAQKPRQVIEAVARFMQERTANVHRGVHALADEATEAFEGARTTIAAFVGADPRATVFTKNATEAMNLVAYSLARRLGPGDVVLSTQMEHHANLVPWQLVQPDAGFTLRHVPLLAGTGGLLDLDAFEREIADGHVRLLTVSAMSNVVGTVPPVARMAAMARRANPDVVVVVDGAQAVPHAGVTLDGLDADLLCFSGHKMLGPSGIGVLAGRADVLEAMPPFLGGGEMILDVTLERSTFNELPYRFEAGTPPLAEAVGLGAAVEYLQTLGMADVAAHECDVTAAAIDGLTALDGVAVHGPSVVDGRGPVVSFTVDGVHPHDVGTLLDREGVAVRAGHHCAKPLVRHLGHAATTRASFSVYSTPDDVRALVDGVARARDFFLGAHGGAS